MNLADIPWILPLLQGVQDGRTLQFKDGHNRWVDITRYLSNVNFDSGKDCYRLKPIPEKLYVVERMLFGSQAWTQVGPVSSSPPSADSMYKLREFVSRASSCKLDDVELRVRIFAEEVQ